MIEKIKKQTHASNTHITPTLPPPTPRHIHICFQPRGIFPLFWTKFDSIKMSIFSIAAEDVFNICCMFLIKLVNYGKLHSKTFMASHAYPGQSCDVRGLCGDGPFICMQSFPGLGTFQIHSIQGKPVVTEPQKNNTQGSDDEKRSSFGTHSKSLECLPCTRLSLQHHLRITVRQAIHPAPPGPGGWQGPARDRQSEPRVLIIKTRWLSLPNAEVQMKLFSQNVLLSFPSAWQIWECKNPMGTPKESHRRLLFWLWDSQIQNGLSWEGILRQNWNTIFLDILTKFFM